MATDTKQQKKVWNPSILTPLEKVRIQHAFANMAKGDAIDGPDLHLIVMRIVDGKGAVIAKSCDSAEHMLQLFDTTFTWSEEKVALVDADGDIPDWWGVDLQVTRDEHLKFAEKYAHIPISAEYPESLLQIIDGGRKAPSTDQINKAAEIFVYGGGLASLIFSAETLGVSVTPIDLAKLYLMYEAVNKIKGKTNITFMIGVPLPLVMPTTENSDSVTKH